MLVRENEKTEIYLLKIEIEDTGHVTNTYVLKDKATNKLLVIDPAFDGDYIFKKISEIGGDVECIAITHSHADHIAGLKRLIDITNAKVYVHELDEKGLYDATLNEEKIVKTKVEPVNKKCVLVVKDEENIVIGNTILTVMHTPGHTAGSLVLYNKVQDLFFSGDTIFEKTYGRTDLTASKPEKMKETLDKIFDKFDDIHVFPGHGEEFYLEKVKRKIKLLFAFKEGR